MKTLLHKDIDSFLQRFVSFEDAEFRSLEIISPTNIKLTFATQDSARGYDWITVSLEFFDITKASLVDDTRLNLVDLSDGVSLDFTTNYIFKIKNATFFIEAQSLKYEEGLF